MKSSNGPIICIAGHRFLTECQGGVELQTFYIGKALAEYGWNVHYLALSNKKKERMEELHKNMKIWWHPASSFEFQNSKKTIWNTLHKINPDILYQRGAGSIRGIVSRFAVKNKIPYVFGLSSDINSKNLNLTKLNLNKIKTFWKKALLLPYFLWLEWIQKRSMMRASHFIIQHEDQLRDIEKKYKAKPFFLRTIHPEIGHKIVKPPDNSIVWINNLRPEKQGEFFIHLAEQLSQLNCRFILVSGRTKEQYLAPLRNLAKNIDNLKILGEISPKEAEGLMEKACLFVNTSYIEGFPNTFVQSWLRETPTISLQVDPGGVLRREGIGICSGSFNKMVEDVKLLVGNEAKRTQMGIKARQYAEKVHGYKNNKKKVDDLFRYIIST